MDPSFSSIFILIFILSLVLCVTTRCVIKLKGFSLQDGYLLGVFIYSLGVIILGFSDEFQSRQLISIGTYCSMVLISSCLGYFISGVLMGGSRINLKTLNLRRTTKFESVLIILTIGIVLLNIIFMYFVYSRILQGHFGGVFALLDIRKTISSGEAGYFAPGLVKQLRDILAPTLLFYLVVFYKGNYKGLAISALLVSTFCAMLIGGQRMPMLILFLVVFIAFTSRNEMLGKSLSFKVKLGLPFLGLVAVYGLNIMLGRSDEGYSVIFSIFLLIWGMFERVVTVVPHENAAALDFLVRLDFEVFALWYADLGILLPGTQKGLSNDIHSLLGGSEAGNSVLGLPVDIYLNSGYMGLLLLPFITVFSLSVLDKLLLRLNSPFIYSSRFIVSIYLPFAYSLYLFILNGGLFILATVLFFLTLPLLKGNHHG